MRPQRIQILDFGSEGDILGSDMARGRPAAALRVVDEAVGIREAIEIGQQVLVVEVRPAVSYFFDQLAMMHTGRKPPCLMMLTTPIWMPSMCSA